MSPRNDQDLPQHKYENETICALLDEQLGTAHLAGRSTHRELITFVEDRPGHDLRYAIDASKIAREIGWVPLETFESGLRKTVQWYLNNQHWWQAIDRDGYQGERLGVVV